MDLKLSPQGQEGRHPESPASARRATRNSDEHVEGGSRESPRLDGLTIGLNRLASIFQAREDGSHLELRGPMKVPIPIVAIAVFLGSGAQAFERSLIQKIAVIGEAGRHTFQEYAARKGLSTAVIEDRYAATGILVCGGMMGSAQLTGASNIVTTSAHLFEDEKTCVGLADPSKCVFKIASGKQVLSYKVAARVATGFTCPNNDRMKAGDDWAILRLEDQVPGVTPYKFPYSEGIVFVEDEQVVAVAGASYDFFVTDRRGNKTYPRTIEDCTVKEIRYVSGNGAYVKTDCDGAMYSSGGSLLRATPQGDMLIGIFKGASETHEMADEAVTANRRNQKAYDSGSWFSIFASVTGAFLKALEAAVR